MDPQSGSSFGLIKGSLFHIETIPAVSTSESEFHPIVTGGSALRDLVATINHLATREAPKLELALTAFHSLYSAICCIGGFNGKVALSSWCGKHFLFNLKVP
jgi:hypothetical protein